MRFLKLLLEPFWLFRDVVIMYFLIGIGLVFYKRLKVAYLIIMLHIYKALNLKKGWITPLSYTSNDDLVSIFYNMYVHYQISIFDEFYMIVHYKYNTDMASKGSYMDLFLTIILRFLKREKNYLYIFSIITIGVGPLVISLIKWLFLLIVDLIKTRSVYLGFLSAFNRSRDSRYIIKKIYLNNKRVYFNPKDSKIPHGFRDVWVKLSKEYDKTQSLKETLVGSSLNKAGIQQNYIDGTTEVKHFIAYKDTKYGSGLVLTHSDLLKNLDICEANLLSYRPVFIAPTDFKQTTVYAYTSDTYYKWAVKDILLAKDTFLHRWLTMSTFNEDKPIYQFTNSSREKTYMTKIKVEEFIEKNDLYLDKERMLEFNLLIKGMNHEIKTKELSNFYYFLRRLKEYNLDVEDIVSLDD